MELMFNEKVKRSQKLRKFGEMCVVTTKAKIQSRLSDKGTVCMFVGYPMNHAGDVYRHLKPKTKHIIKSTDVLRLEKIYGEWLKSREHSDIDKKIRIMNLKFLKINFIGESK
jgi:hypothetical protein